MLRNRREKRRLRLLNRGKRQQRAKPEGDASKPSESIEGDTSAQQKVSEEQNSKMESSKRRPRKNELTGSERAKTKLFDAGEGGSLRSKQRSMRQVSLDFHIHGLQSSKSRKKNKMMSSDQPHRKRSQFFKAKASHKQIIPENVQEENNEETENEDMKNNIEMQDPEIKKYE